MCVVPNVHSTMDCRTELPNVLCTTQTLFSNQFIHQKSCVITMYIFIGCIILCTHTKVGGVGSELRCR